MGSIKTIQSDLQFICQGYTFTLKSLYKSFLRATGGIYTMGTRQLEMLPIDQALWQILLYNEVAKESNPNKKNDVRDSVSLEDQTFEKID